MAQSSGRSRPTKLKMSTDTTAFHVATPPSYCFCPSFFCIPPFFPTTTARLLKERHLRGIVPDSLVEIPAEPLEFAASEGEELAARKPRPPPNNTWWDEHALPVVELKLGAPYVPPSPRTWQQDTPTAVAPAPTTSTALKGSTAPEDQTTAVSADDSLKTGDSTAAGLKPGNMTERKQIWPPRNVTLVYAKVNNTGKIEMNKSDKPSRKLLAGGLRARFLSGSGKGLLGTKGSINILQDSSMLQGSDSSHSLQECMPHGAASTDTPATSHSLCKPAVVFTADSSNNSSSDDSTAAASKVPLFVAQGTRSPTTATTDHVSDTGHAQSPQQQWSHPLGTEDASMNSVSNNITDSLSDLSADKMVDGIQVPSRTKEHHATVFVAKSQELPPSSSSSSTAEKVVHVFAAKGTDN